MAIYYPYTRNEWRRAPFTGGLDNTPFRVFVFAGSADYQPTTISQANAATRSRILGSLSAPQSVLAADLRALIALSLGAARDGGAPVECAAFIRPDGHTTAPISGTRTGFGGNLSPPAGVEVEGFVHTHPTTQSVAPPSSNDFGPYDFRSYPVQLVAETEGRVWQMFYGGWSTYLGLLQPERFEPATHGVDLVFQVRSSDQRRLDDLDAERRAADERWRRYREAARNQRPMRP